jgi:ESF2/ABP1 family protein
VSLHPQHSQYYDDMWSMKYLPKFKWHHLTERVSYDRAVRKQRLQAEMQQVQRESNAYVEQVTKAKMWVFGAVWVA